MTSKRATRYRAKQTAAVAYHEAGHAVAACLMRVPFTEVRITPDSRGRAADGVAGHVALEGAAWPDWAVPVHPSFDRKRARQYVAHNVCMTLAGPLAETLHTRCWQDLPMNEGDDEFWAWELSECLYPARKQRSDWVNRLRFHTLETLQAADVWAAVDAVARELVIRQALDCATVYALVAASCKRCSAR